MSDGSEPSAYFRHKPDVLLTDDKGERAIRVSVLPKARRSRGTIRIDASNLRTIELVEQPRTRKWRIEAGAIPIHDDVRAAGWGWLVKLLFRP